MGSPSNSDQAVAEVMAATEKKPNFGFFIPGLPDGKLDSIDLSKHENLIIVDAAKFQQDPRKTLKAYQAASNPPKPNEGKPAPAATTVPETPAASPSMAVVSSSDPT